MDFGFGMNSRGCDLPGSLLPYLSGWQLLQLLRLW